MRLSGFWEFTKWAIYGCCPKDKIFRELQEPDLKPFIIGHSKVLPVIIIHYVVRNKKLKNQR